MIFALLALLGLSVFILTDDDDEPEAEATDAPPPEPVEMISVAKFLGMEGDDTLVASDGDDKIVGDAGDDVLIAGDGDDLLVGGPGDDILAGGAGDDTMEGNQGDDLIFDEAGADEMNGGNGDDLIFGADILDHAELVKTSAEQGTRTDPFSALDWEDAGEPDTISGGNGDDLMFLGANDHATGGNGDDFYMVGDWVKDAGAPPEVHDFSQTPGNTDLVGYMKDMRDGPAQIEVAQTLDGDSATVMESGTAVLTVNKAPGSLVQIDVFTLSVDMQAPAL